MVKEKSQRPRGNITIRRENFKLLHLARVENQPHFCNPLKTHLNLPWSTLRSNLLSVFLAVSLAVFWFNFQLCKRSLSWRWASHVVVCVYFRGQVLLRDKRICTACLKCYICTPHQKKFTPQSTGDRIQWRTSSYDWLTGDKRGPTACHVCSGKCSRENQDSAIVDSWSER